jgi:hypothetical protein
MCAEVLPSALIIELLKQTFRCLDKDFNYEVDDLKKDPTVIPKTNLLKNIFLSKTEIKDDKKLKHLSEKVPLNNGTNNNASHNVGGPKNGLKYSSSIGKILGKNN